MVPGVCEAKHECHFTKPRAGFDEIAKGGGWSPYGFWEILQTITLSPDGNSFDSTPRLRVLDPQGKPTEATGEATAKGSRITF